MNEIRTEKERLAKEDMVTIRQLAEEELVEEEKRKLVVLMKEKIKMERSRSFLRRIFPWKITIERR